MNGFTAAMKKTKEADRLEAYPTLAKRLAARTGLGVGLITERLAAHNDDAAIEALLAENKIPEILQLLEPSNKA